MTESRRDPGAPGDYSIVIHGAPGAREWLSAAGFTGEVYDAPHNGGANGRIAITRTGARAHDPRLLLWHPETFKQVLSRALALGAAAGCHAGMMTVIADGEARLATLRDRLGIDRKAGPEHLVPCEVFLEDRSEPPPWTPDLIDRAAGRTPLREIQENAQIVLLGPDILVPGPHLYDVVLRIARTLHPNRI